MTLDLLPRGRDERLAALELRVAHLESTLEEVEGRLEGTEPFSASTPSLVPAAATGGPPNHPAQTLPAVPVAFALAGRACLVLGGAFLVRALTEAGTLRPLAGAVLGLAYAALWLGAASRAGDRPASALVHGLTAALIAFPLVAETATRFGVLSPLSAHAVLIAVTCTFLFAAATLRQMLLAWATVVGTLATMTVLLVHTLSIELSVAAALVLLAATAGLALRAGVFSGARWLAALSADTLVVLMAAILGREGGPPEAYAHVSPTLAVAFSLTLAIVSLAAVVLASRTETGAFEWVQGAVGLAVGLLAAAHVASARGLSVSPLAWGAFATAAALYGVAFVGVRRGPPSAAILLSTLALGLALATPPLALSIVDRALFWAGLAMLATTAGLRDNLSVLRVHAACYALAAAFGGSLFAQVAAAFSARRPEPDAAATLTAFAAASAYLMLSARPSTSAGRVSRLVLAGIALAGAGGLAVAGIAKMVGSPASLAAAGTCVLSAAALGLSLTRSSERFRELSHFVYPVLALAGAKLLLVDLRAGGAATLFLAFGAYGLALILAPRVLAARAEEPTPR